MFSTLLIISCISAAFAQAVLKQADVLASPCSEDICNLKNDCRCASAINPLGSNQVAPQLISLTFDEALTDNLYTEYWEPFLFHRINPDGQPIGATFFVPHEYTDYGRVNDLYNYGFEIGVHSITKNPHQSYWRNASRKLLTEEFAGQKAIIAKFANIPAADIIGVRTPQLQLAENASIQAYIDSNLSYDSSWPTLPDKPLFPYTLDYLSTQQCTLGSKCPNEAFKGFWVLPIVDLNGKGEECNSLATCNITGTADVIADWLLNEINQIRLSTRAPITLLVNSYWFNFTENSLEGFTKCLDKLADYKDVFLVTQKQVLDWAKNPVPLEEFKTDVPERNANCNIFNCKYKNREQNERHMRACVPCPLVYPWIEDPEGKSP